MSRDQSEGRFTVTVEGRVYSNTTSVLDTDSLAGRWTMGILSVFVPADTTRVSPRGLPVPLVSRAMVICETFVAVPAIWETILVHVPPDISALKSTSQ